MCVPGRRRRASRNDRENGMLTEELINGSTKPSHQGNLIERERHSSKDSNSPILRHFPPLATPAHKQPSISNFVCVNEGAWNGCPSANTELAPFANTFTSFEGNAITPFAGNAITPFSGNAITPFAGSDITPFAPEIGQLAAFETAPLTPYGPTPITPFANPPHKPFGVSVSLSGCGMQSALTEAPRSPHKMGAMDAVFPPLPMHNDLVLFAGRPCPVHSHAQPSYVGFDTEDPDLVPFNPVDQLILIFSSY